MKPENRSGIIDNCIDQAHGEPGDTSVNDIESAQPRAATIPDNTPLAESEQSSISQSQPIAPVPEQRSTEVPRESPTPTEPPDPEPVDEGVIPDSIPIIGRF